MAYFKKVNTADPKVVKVLADLYLKTFAEKSFPTLAGDWWVALEKGKPIGFCAIRPALSTDGAGYLYRVGVVKAHRGRGLQKRMITLREAFALDAGFKCLVTDTTGNPASERSLESCGFSRYDPPFPWGQAGSVYWRKALHA